MDATDAQQSGGRLVYLPLDKVPKELLERLGHYKVFALDNKNGPKPTIIEDVSHEIVNSKQTEEEMCKSIACEDESVDDSSKKPPAHDQPQAKIPPIAKTTSISQDTTLRVHSEDEIFTLDHMISSQISRRTSPEFHLIPRNDHQNEREIHHQKSPPLNIFNKPSSPHHTGQMHHEHYNNRSPSRHPVSRQVNGIHDDAHFFGSVSGRQSTSVVSTDIDARLQMLKNMLEKTPSKTSATEDGFNRENIPRTPRRIKCDSWEDARRATALREMPSPAEHQHYAHSPSARKQLFELAPPEVLANGYFDSNEIRDITRGYFPQRGNGPVRGPLPLSPMQELNVYPKNLDRQDIEYGPEAYSRGQKRKMSCNDSLASPRKLGRSRPPSNALENLFQFHNPSKRSCCEEDIGPEPETTSFKKVNCACTFLESNFLQMTQCAYKNIRRKDSSPEGFEQFKRELAQTNELLKQSVTLLQSIQEICKHRPQTS